MKENGNGTTRAAALDELTPENAAFLPIDYMHGLISAARSIDPGELRNNAIALAKIARLFGLPAVGTGDQVGRTWMGAEMTEISEILPDMPVFPRTTVSAWETPEYREAVEATGRTKLVMAGISTEQCVLLTAKSAIADGYGVYVVLDASGSLDARAEAAAVARLTQMGAVLTTWPALGMELLGDVTRPEAAGLFEITARHHGAMGALGAGFETARASGAATARAEGAARERARVG